MLNDPTLLPHFSLTCEPLLEPSLLQRLQQWAAEEDKYIYDNTELLREGIRIESVAHFEKQKQLLQRAEGVKGKHSFDLFLL